MTKLTLIGKSEDGSVEVYRLGDNIYRVGRGWVPDINGIPMGMRWECSVEHWKKFKRLLTWIKEVENE